MQTHTTKKEVAHVCILRIDLYVYYVLYDYKTN